MQNYTFSMSYVPLTPQPSRSHTVNDLLRGIFLNILAGLLRETLGLDTGNYFYFLLLPTASEKKLQSHRPWTQSKISPTPDQNLYSLFYSGLVYEWLIGYLPLHYLGECLTK